MKKKTENIKSLPKLFPVPSNGDPTAGLWLGSDDYINRSMIEGAKILKIFPDFLF